MAMHPRAVENDDPQQSAIWNELRPILHEEVNWLPPKFGILVILSYMEGKTNEEVADLLKCPVGTVKGSLYQAREMLRRRLLRRGMALSAALLLTLLSRGIVSATEVPPELVDRTVRLAGAAARRSRALHASPSSDESPIATSIRNMVKYYEKHSLIGTIMYLASIALAAVAIAAGIGLAVAAGASSAYVGGLSATVSPTSGASHCH
jgi:Sigma-70, region 4